MKWISIILFFLASIIAGDACGQTIRYTPNGTRFDYLNGLKVGGFIRLPSDTTASADTFSVAVKNGTIYQKGSDMKWHVVSGGGGIGDIDTTYQLIFSGLTYDRYLVLAYTDSSTIPHTSYYNDSIAPKGGPPILDAVWSVRKYGMVDSVGWWKPGIQWALDGDPVLTRRNRILGHSMLDFDSMGMKIRQGFFRDTALSIYFGSSSSPHLALTKSGLFVSSITRIGNNFSFAPSSGMRVSGVPFIIDPLGTEGEIMSEQQVLYLTRSYPGVPVNGGINYGTLIRNRTTNGTVYAYPTKSNFRPFGVSFTTSGGVTDTVFWVNAWGHVYMRPPWQADLTGVDSAIVIRNGILTAVPISAIGGGFSDLTPESTIATTSFTISEPTDHRQKTYLISTLGAAVTVTAPSSPTHGQIISLFMQDFGPGGSVIYPTFEGTRTLTSSGQSVSLQWSDFVAGYIEISKVNSGTAVDSAIFMTRARDMQRLDSITKFRRTPASFTSGTTITVDYTSRERFIGTLSHNAVFSISNMLDGEVVFYIINGSGGPYTATFPGGFKPTLKPATGDTTMIIGSKVGSSWFFSTSQPMASGGYTPTLTGENNISSVVLSGVDYYRSNDRVFVTGTLLITPVSAGATSTIIMSLPIPADVSSSSDVRGTFSVSTGLTSGGVVTGNSPNDSAYFTFVPSVNTSALLGFSFSYTVK
jgi:hypothetical protein